MHETAYQTRPMYLPDAAFSFTFPVSIWNREISVKMQLHIKDSGSLSKRVFEEINQKASFLRRKKMMLLVIFWSQVHEHFINNRVRTWKRMQVIKTYTLSTESVILKQNQSSNDHHPYDYIFYQHSFSSTENNKS